MSLTPAEQSRRSLERSLYVRIKEGDPEAMWELFDTASTTVRKLAERYAGGDDIVAGQMEAECDIPLTSALKSWNPTGERFRYFSFWCQSYVQRHFASIRKGEPFFSDQDMDALPEESPNGFKDGRPLHDGSAPGELDDSMPHFLDPVTQQVAEMLVRGFTHVEIRAATGLGETVLTNKLNLIARKLSGELG